MDRECKVCGETNDVDEGTILYTCPKCSVKVPQSDPSGLLTPERRTEIWLDCHSDDIWAEYETRLCEEQRDLTASEKDAEFAKSLPENLKPLLEQAHRSGQIESQVHTEALIEWLEGDCPHVSHGRARHWCGECWDDFKATHTSKGEEGLTKRKCPHCKVSLNKNNVCPKCKHVFIFD